MTREEIEEQDFKDLVASSGSEEEDDETAPTQDNNTSAKSSKSKASQKARTDKLRSLLLNGGDDDDDAADVWGKAGTAWREELAEMTGANGKSKAKGKGKGKAGEGEGDVEITFKPGLSVSGLAVNGADDENLTTLERYQMRMKERKARKKEKMELKKAAKEGSDDDEGEKRSKREDDFFGEESGDDSEEDVPAITAVKPKSSRSIPDSSAKSKPAPVMDTKEKEKNAKPAVGNGTKPDTDLPSDLQTPTEHFSMKDILRAEKAQGKKRKRSRKTKKDTETIEEELGPDGWKMNVKDERFKALHEEPEFAIDPSDPQ